MSESVSADNTWYEHDPEREAAMTLSREDLQRMAEQGRPADVARTPPSNTDAIQEGEGDDFETLRRALGRRYPDEKLTPDSVAWQPNHEDAHAALDRIARTIEQQQARERFLEATIEKNADVYRARIEELEAALEQARPVLGYVSRGRRFVDVEPYPDALARRVLGSWPDPSTKGEGE